MEEQNNTNEPEENNAGLGNINPAANDTNEQQSDALFQPSLNLSFVNKKVSETREQIGAFVIGQH